MTVENVKKAIGMEGLLFVPHPQIGSWKTTRALAPEIVAFTNQEASPKFFRLAIEFHEGGIPDENGYVPETDEYRVVSQDLGPFGEWPAEGVYRTPEEAAEKAAEIMIEVTGERE